MKLNKKQFPTLANVVADYAPETSIDPMELKKFKEGLNIFLRKKLGEEFTLSEGMENDLFLELGDIIAPDVNNETPLLDSFLESLTQFFSTYKDKKTYKTIWPNWESTEDVAKYRIYLKDEEGMSSESSAVEADKLPGGKGDDMPDSSFDKSQLQQGVEHEKEHTKDSEIAKEIAKDHLTEDPEYYTHLHSSYPTLSKVLASKMFENFDSYKEMLLKKGFTKEDLNKEEKFIKDSFNMDVNILDLTESLNKKLGKSLGSLAAELPVLSKVLAEVATADKVETHCFPTWNEGLMKLQEAQNTFNYAMGLSAIESLPVDIKAELAEIVADVYKLQADVAATLEKLKEVDPQSIPKAAPQVAPMSPAPAPSPAVQEPKPDVTTTVAGTADEHQKRIAIDTVKNPDKALLGGPSVAEAIETLKKKFKYTDEQIKKLQGK